MQAYFGIMTRTSNSFLSKYLGREPTTSANPPVLINGTHFYIDLAWRKQYVGILEMEYEGVKFYFVDNEFYFAGMQPYGNIHEDIEKFAFFCKASLSALPSLDFH